VARFIEEELLGRLPQNPATDHEGPALLKLTAPVFATAEILKAHDLSPSTTDFTKYPCSLCRRVQPWVSSNPDQASA
jgi:hypothetical protein